MKESSSNGSQDELHPIVGDSQKSPTRSPAPSSADLNGESSRKQVVNRGPVIPAPHNFQLPEMLSYCLSSDLSTLLYCSANAETILGCPIHQVRANGGILLRHVHFDDRFRVLNALEEALLTKSPSVVSYRWHLPDDAKTSVFVNHCVAAHSDYGEVITGVIFRITPRLNEELAHLFHQGVPAGAGGDPSETQPVHTVTLSENLKPFHQEKANGRQPGIADSQSSTTTARTIPFLSNDQERAFLRYLAEELSHRIAIESKSGNSHVSRRNHSFGDYLFDGQRVYLGTLTKVVKDTFSPHYLFTLKDVTSDYLKRQELKSLRRLRSGLSASRFSLTDVERKLEEVLEQHSENPELCSQLLSCKEQLAAATEQVSRRLSDPFLPGRELLLKSSEPLAAELSGNVEMKLALGSPHLVVWRSVGEELLLFLTQLTSQLLPIADSARLVEISLQQVEESSISLETTLFLPISLEEECKAIIARLNQITPAGGRPLLIQQSSLRPYGREVIFRMVITAVGAMDGNKLSHN